MHRPNLPLHGSSPLNGDEYRARVFLVGVLLVAIGMSGAQETSLAKKPLVQNLAVLFATASSTRRALPLAYDSRLNVEQLQIVRYSQTTLFEVHPSSNQLLKTSGFARYRFTADAQLFRKNKNWLRGTLDKPAAFVPAFGNAPYEKRHRTEGVEQYIRHIPTAGPMIGRIWQQARAHPHFTRALFYVSPRSMILYLLV